MIVLGIETSCDETAAAVCEDGSIKSNIVSQQVLHSKFGGVVPEIASREHDFLLNQVVDQAISDAQIGLNQLNAIAVTQGPGLSGTLLTGISFAKGLAIALNIPIVPVNHLEGHIYANFLAKPDLQFPFLCLLVSGGHTQIWNIIDIDNYILLGETRDDAAGEAFDKGARIFGLGYPGGPLIEKKAKLGKSDKVDFPRILLGSGNLEFSFSGLKTSLLYYMDTFEETVDINLNDVIASYQMAIIDTLSEKIRRAVLKTKSKRCVIAGGVAANQSLREKIKIINPETEFVFPDLNFCTDNAAMISFLGEIKMKSSLKEKFQDFSFSAIPNLKL
jgi:N6-L-threonylcarbamoyladenine synthase